MPVEVLKCLRANIPWHEDHQENWKFNKLISDVSPRLTVTILRRNQFSTFPRHGEPLTLFFWETDKVLLRNTGNNWGFGCFPTVLSTLTFGSVIGQNVFLALPIFKYPFLKNENGYQKFGLHLIEQNLWLTLVVSVSLRLPKWWLGEDEVRDEFWKTGFFVLQWTIVNFGPSPDLITLELDRLEDLNHCFEVRTQPSDLSKFPKHYRNLNFRIFRKTCVTLQKLL